MPLARGLLLGSIIDREANGQPNAAATGDDTKPTGKPDDEDGVTSALTFTEGGAAAVTLNYINPRTSRTTIAGWIDFDRDGVFELNERVVVTRPANSQGTVTLSFSTVPLTAATAAYQTFARFRIFSGNLAEPSPIGSSNAGEVEDYRVTINPAQ